MRDDLNGAPVLLVDDEPRNLLALEAILEGCGHRLLTAGSGDDALKMALREVPAVILLDVLMPDIDGYEVARQLKTVERTREIPIIFLTALATDVEYIYRAYEAGAVDYLIKPLDPEVVRRKVDVFVDLMRQREEIKRQSAALVEANLRAHQIEVAELRLASDRRYRKLVEGIDHAIGWTMDERLAFTFVSRRAPEILGYSAVELAQPRFWSDHTHPDDADALVGMFRKALAEGTELVCNHRLLHADGRTLWFHTGVSGERAGRDGGAELHGISVDVTDIKRAQEEAQKATHVREELIAIVAHDLRNPLNSIASSVGLLQSVADKVHDPLVQRGAHAIGRAVDHMDRIINDLLDFALIQAERLVITAAPVDAKAMLQECVAMFEPIAVRKSLQLQTRGGDGLVVRGDRHRLIQILSNLIGNSIKFTPEGGRIVLAAERDGGEAVFIVSDTGRGMSDEETSRMWDRYWQGEARSRGSLGLGLAVARGLVEAQRGRIWAESRLGVGTTVYFTVPLLTASHDAAPPSA